jgi:hypothetical protein
VLSTINQPTVQSELPVRSWLLPYDRRVISTPLDEATVCVQLNAYLERLYAMPRPSLFSSAVRYEGALERDTLRLDGPIGNRRFRLDTRGNVRTAPDGTAIELTLRLSRVHMLAMLGQLVFLWTVPLIIGFPLVMVLLLSGFAYVATMLSFWYETGQIVRQLLVAVGPQPQGGEQGMIVPDGIGWRCGSCGGYVREDATFCKHCKQPFTARM